MICTEGLVKHVTEYVETRIQSGSPMQYDRRQRLRALQTIEQQMKHFGMNGCDGGGDSGPRTNPSNSPSSGNTVRKEGTRHSRGDNVVPFIRRPNGNDGGRGGGGGGGGGSIAADKDLELSKKEESRELVESTPSRRRYSAGKDEERFSGFARDAAQYSGARSTKKKASEASDIGQWTSCLARCVQGNVMTTPQHFLSKSTIH